MVDGFEDGGVLRAYRFTAMRDSMTTNQHGYQEVSGPRVCVLYLHPRHKCCELHFPQFDSGRMPASIKVKSIFNMGSVQGTFITGGLIMADKSL